MIQPDTGIAEKMLQRLLLHKHHSQYPRCISTQ